ncbi:FAD-binding oxidoreductase [Rhodopseudomonas palustris]|uniref:FAD linked oxidase-like n=1 Tax=Rhodopseudomonas palustris (strain BisB18) TaxID=316056 RepID=Q20YQ2_RHOPB
MRHRLALPGSMTELIALVGAGSNAPFLAHGCGRSYGDVALNPGGLLIDCRGLDRFIAFDPETGHLVCEAGVRLADILRVICRPDQDGAGFFLPVSPGTRFISVGGAIANDVHGKNHHVFGSFGNHVESFVLLRSSGEILRCSESENAELYAATIGGLGLTGIILQATLKLRRVDGLAFEAEDIAFGSLDDYFQLAVQSDLAWEYTAAWIDCFAKGADIGRGIFSRSRHVAGVGAPPPPLQPRISIPWTPPISVVNRVSTRAFNALYRRKLGKLGKRTSTGSYEQALYPLDGLGNWNRLYGRDGFFQFQNVIPRGCALEVVRAMLREVVAAGAGSMLSVLKVFGALPSRGLLSFPMEGVTFALDFPNDGSQTVRLIERLEAITIESNGRIYPAKDSLMSRQAFWQGYPFAGRFQDSMDPAISSEFAIRVGLAVGRRR